MFTFGEQLYRLTSRDEETLLVESAFRSVNFDIPAAQATLGIDMNLPVDRATYLHSLVLFLNATAASTWTVVNLEVFLPGGLTRGAVIWATSDAAAGTGLVFDRQAGASGVGGRGSIYVPINLVIPPASGQLRLTVSRAGTANAAIGNNVSMNAYVIPPGRIGRL